MHKETKELLIAITELIIMDSHLIHGKRTKDEQVNVINKLDAFKNKPLNESKEAMWDRMERDE